jgi:PhoPQ-activated pathogenicity-related protein
MALLILGSIAGAPAARADLAGYVKRPDKAFAWKVEKAAAHKSGNIYELSLVSQVWQGITWKHKLEIYEPNGVAPKATMLLWNTGGSASFLTRALGMELARLSQSPCAFLYHIPNQPLFGGKKEDALIAETFVRYLKTGDENWPLLFPMVKSVVKAMDALQAFSQKEWGKSIDHFVVSGASKRGWTTWLTAAVDPRVKAIAPLVIDTLNMAEQMNHQKKAFGEYSEQINDYTRAHLVPMPNTPEARRLWRMVDPYTYRDRLTLPKLLINGNNDPYWSTDALNLYWDGLKGPKWVLYIPNAGHSLQQRQKNGRTDHSQAIAGLAAFVRHQVVDNPMPVLHWQHTDAGDQLRLRVQADPAPRAARLWVAEGPTPDLRKAQWQSRLVRMEKGTLDGQVPRPRKGYVAFYAELDYEIDGIAHHLSTQLRLVGAPVSKNR